MEEAAIEKIFQVSSTRQFWQDGRSLYLYSHRKVFINIPYDSAYQPLEQALCSTLIAYDLVPVLAKSTRRQVVRIEKIIKLIKACKYGISDVSRFDRHNMPFEHGIMTILLGSRSFVLCQDRIKAKKRMSDIEGFEPVGHDSNPKLLVTKTSQWLLENARKDIEPHRCDIEPEWIIGALPAVRKYLKVYQSYARLAKYYDSFLAQALGA